METGKKVEAEVHDKKGCCGTRVKVNEEGIANSTGHMKALVEYLQLSLYIRIMVLIIMVSK